MTEEDTDGSIKEEHKERLRKCHTKLLTDIELTLLPDLFEKGLFCYLWLALTHIWGRPLLAGSFSN